MLPLWKEEPLYQRFSSHTGEWGCLLSVSAAWAGNRLEWEQLHCMACAVWGTRQGVPQAMGLCQQWAGTQLSGPALQEDKGGAALQYFQGRPSPVQAHGWMLSFFLLAPPLMLQGIQVALEQPGTLLETLCTFLHWKWEFTNWTWVADVFSISFVPDPAARGVLWAHYTHVGGWPAQIIAAHKEGQESI